MLQFVWKELKGEAGDPTDEVGWSSEDGRIVAVCGPLSWRVEVCGVSAKSGFVSMMDIDRLSKRTGKKVGPRSVACSRAEAWIAGLLQHQEAE